MTAHAEATLPGSVPADAPVPVSKTMRILDAALRMRRDGTPPPARVADFPCGSGHLSARAARGG